MAKTFKRTEFLRLKPFKNEQKKHGSTSRNRAEETPSLIPRLFSIYHRLTFHPATYRP